jgi:hypothetical protein
VESSLKPDFLLAKKTLPAPLLKAICHVFSQGVQKASLVGGTALSGFYAGHRMSDDIDIFVKDPISFKVATLAVESLVNLGASLQPPTKSHHYYHTVMKFNDHQATIDVVIDSNLFKVGKFETLDNGIVIADLKTLTMMKAATLVSRASEKDLYDLFWLFENYPNLTLEKIIKLGNQIDSGFGGEALLVSLGGALLKEEACHFSLIKNVDSKQIFDSICKLRESLIAETKKILKNEKPSDLQLVVKMIKKLYK